MSVIAGYIKSKLTLKPTDRTRLDALLITLNKRVDDCAIDLYDQDRFCITYKVSGIENANAKDAYIDFMLDAFWRGADIRYLHLNPKVSLDYLDIFENMYYAPIYNSQKQELYIKFSRLPIRPNGTKIQEEF